MQELSLNVLDIAENSVAANATLISIAVCMNLPENRLVLTVEDNGKGMSAEMLARVTDPFCTSRTTRKVGLGVPFFKMAAEMTGGGLHIASQEGVGTTLMASFVLGHIDLAPLGDMTSTIATLIQCNPELDFVYTVTVGESSFTADTRALRQVLDGVSLATPEVAMWLREYLDENTAPLLRQQYDTEKENAT